MSHYRVPPAVLPSLRALDAPYPGEGDRSRWDEDVDEQIARLRAVAAPCPTFTVDPAATLPPTSQVFQYVPPPVKTRSGQSWRVVIE